MIVSLVSDGKAWYNGVKAAVLGFTEYEAHWISGHKWRRTTV